MIHLDTHVLIWLHIPEPRRLSPNARDHLSRERCLISPIVMLEMQFLHERGRILDPAKAIFRSVADGMGLELSQAGFGDIVEAAEPLGWTRDPFDRLIVATAAAEGSRLLTADEVIRKNFAGAIW